MKPIFSKKRFQDPELMILRSELLEAQSELAQAYRQFNQAVDPELVESYRAIKERGPQAAAAAQVEGDAIWT